MANPVIKVWLREPRKAWKNDGGPIPRGFRSRLKQLYTGKRMVVKTERSETVRKGHWAVIAGGSIYSFSPEEMKRLYSRIPL
jgi:hypothetical protein